MLKIAVTPKYQDDYKFKKDAGIGSTIELVEAYPSYLDVMEMPFRKIMLWVYPFSDRHTDFHTGSIPPAEAKAMYDEIYAFTSMLLKRY